MALVGLMGGFSPKPCSFELDPFEGSSSLPLPPLMRSRRDWPALEVPPEPDSRDAREGRDWWRSCVHAPSELPLAGRASRWCQRSETEYEVVCTEYGLFCLAIVVLRSV